MQALQPGSDTAPAQAAEESRKPSKTGSDGVVPDIAAKGEFTPFIAYLASCLKLLFRRDA